jgi:2'-5' RNA ligase
VKLEILDSNGSVGTVRNDGDALTYAGARPQSVQRLVENMAMFSENAKGQALLAFMKKRLQGHVRAKEVHDKKNIDTTLLTPNLAQLAKEQSQGAMVAFMLDPDTANKLALPGCIASEELHITLAFLGDKEQLESASEPIIANITPLLTKIAEAQQGPIVGKTTGNIKSFPASDEGIVPVYAEVQFDDLDTLQERIQQAALESGAPEPIYAFTPHITLAYIPEGDPLPAKHVEELALSFSALTLMHAGERLDFSCGEQKDFLFYKEKRKKNEEQEASASALYQHFVKQLRQSSG